MEKKKLKATNREILGNYIYLIHRTHSLLREIKGRGHNHKSASVPIAMKTPCPFTFSFLKNIIGNSQQHRELSGGGMV